MKQELKRVDPLRTANVAALVYGVLMCAFAVMFLPIFLLPGLLGASGQSGLETVFLGFMVVLYPVLGAVMGWITGLLGAAVYNLVVRWIGGVILEFEAVPPGPGAAHAGLAPTERGT